MKSELIFSGIGGQGTILMGKMACTAASKKGYNVTLSPAYGQEKRGGRASCQVVISEEVGSMIISEADTILVMDEKSLKDYESKVKAGIENILEIKNTCEVYPVSYIALRLIQKLQEQTSKLLKFLSQK